MDSKVEMKEKPLKAVFIPLDLRNMWSRIELFKTTALETCCLFVLKWHDLEYMLRCQHCQKTQWCHHWAGD